MFRCFHLILAVGALSLLCLPIPAIADDPPPVVPVGLDAYRHWELWPFQRIGVRTYLRSTYDRYGGNEGADASHFLYQLGEDDSVALDVAGPGVLYFARFNHWHGSPWHFVIDGSDHVVQESSTSDPNHPVFGSTFLPPNVFPEPIAYTWSTTHGADLIGVPMPFESSLQIGYSRTHYGTGYYIFQQFVRGIPLSQPIQSWDGVTPPDKDVLDLVSRAGSNLVPAWDSDEGRKQGINQFSAGPFDLGKDNYKTVETLEPAAPRIIRSLEFSVPRAEAVDFGKAHIRITWDDRNKPSVDTPLALFFGAGTLYNRDNREFLVKAFPVNIRFDADRVHLACYFPMPFFRSAKFEMTGNGESDLTDIVMTTTSQPFDAKPDQVGYFHATYHDQGVATPGHDLILLDTAKTEGGGDWSGSIVGTSFIFSDQANLTTLEGDPRFYFDDSQSPQVQGTGTEEWCGGGDYWGGQNLTLPFYGHPTGARDAQAAINGQDKIESAYRFLLADLMPFGKNAVVGLEHGGTDESAEHYQTVAFWYGLQAASLVKTDSLKVGDSASEKAHKYSSPTSSPPYFITSRYERGVDHLNGIEIYPQQTDKGRTMTGMSEFTIKLTPDNLGVMLRRKLDYSFPNQRAEVYISDTDGVKPPVWKLAGVWLTAGSNSCVYSNPRDELGFALHNVETSNRRFRDDEFLVPRDLTQGQSAVHVRVKFISATIPLFPGYSQQKMAWSEIRYDVYCFVMPKFTFAGSSSNR